MKSIDSTLSDDRFIVLASPRRQYLLNHVLANDGEVKLTELGLRIAIEEADSPSQSVDVDTVREVHDSIYLKHVPLLVEYDLIEFDRDNELVRATPKLYDLMEELDETTDGTRPWLLYYAVPAVLLVGLILVVDFLSFPDSAPSLWWVTVLGLLVLLSVSGLKFVDG